MGRWLKMWVSLGLPMVVLTSLKEDMTAQAVDIDSSGGQTDSTIKGIDIVPQSEENMELPENLEFVINKVVDVCQPQKTSLQQSCTWQTKSIARTCSASLSKQKPFSYLLKCSNKNTQNLRGASDEVTDTMNTNKEKASEVGSSNKEGLVNHVSARCLECIFGMIE